MLRKGWLIKVTYLDGIHAGKSWYMTKGGYVRSPGTEIVWDDEAYKTEAAAKRVCTMYAKNNERDIRFEKTEQEYRKHKGFEPMMHLFDHEAYEPAEVDVHALR